MRLATYTAGSLVLTALSATVAYAFFFVEFVVVVTLILVITAVLLVTPGKKKKAPKLTQKVTFQMTDGFAFLTPGSEGPASLGLNGTLTVKKSRPELANPPVWENFQIAFPVSKTNSKDTKGSLKAGNDELSGFRSGLDAFLTYAANLDAPPGKTTKAFIGGDIVSSDSRQRGSVKVDTRTFTKLKAAVSLKGDCFPDNGPNDIVSAKYKLKVKLKPRKPEF